MKKIIYTEQIERELEVLPCIKCGNHNIELDDCGYTTFNVAWGKCLGCGHEVRINPAPWNLDIKLLAKTWNNANNAKILKTEYEQKILELQKKINELNINTK